MGDCPTEMLHQKMLPAHLDGDQDVGGPKQVQKCRCHAILKKKKKKKLQQQSRELQAEWTYFGSQETK